MKTFEISRRLQKLPPYLFAAIDAQKRQLRARGVSLIDLSIGDPDIPSPAIIAKTLYEYARVKEYQKYPLDAGLPSFKAEIAHWFKGRFNVALDAQSEILTLIGSKEGLVHFPLAFVDPGDYVLIPSPGYPGYRGACVLSGALIHEMPLIAERGFLPQLEKIPARVRNKAKIIYLNYPNNPTSALAPRGFLEDLVRFCRRYGIIIAYDNAYSEVYFDEKPASILEIKGAKEVAIEFHSFSKTFCMTGHRLGWACGNEALVKGLLKVKTNVDSGAFLALQKAGEIALKTQTAYMGKIRAIIKERRDIVVDILAHAGFTEIHADSTFYVWARIPVRFASSIEYASYLLNEKRIVATPGAGFGRFGEGYIRFALTVDKKMLRAIKNVL